MSTKVMARFYAPPELWAAAQDAMTEAGFTYSEGLTRMLALLVASKEADRAKLFRISPAKALAIAAERKK